MIQEQISAEMHYRLGKYVLELLMDTGAIPPSIAESTRKALCAFYKPFTHSLEECDLWQKES